MPLWNSPCLLEAPKYCRQPPQAEVQIKMATVEPNRSLTETHTNFGHVSQKRSFYCNPVLWDRNILLSFETFPSTQLDKPAKVSTKRRFCLLKIS